MTRELRNTMATVAAVLEMSRDRLGRLEQVSDADREARENLRKLAIKYDATGQADYMGQCAAVLRAALAKAKKIDERNVATANGCF
jgi:hypothetical protein